MTWWGEIPDYLKSPDKLEEFIEWLIELPVDRHTKGLMLLEWCQAMGIKCEREWLDRVTQGRSWELRG
ncbi:MAG: hypothetical protein DRJ18_00645 [Candidatus Methanomethylicota archaeon]|nr:MAG: hypothetical protein DRJ18_00645 [Candidatus Verstraetearchaeota archaeon]